MLLLSEYVPISVPELMLLVLPELPEEFVVNSVVDFVVDFVSDPVLPEPVLPEFVVPDFVPELPVEAEFELLPDFLFPPPGLPCPPRPGPP